MQKAYNKMTANESIDGFHSLSAALRSATTLTVSRDFDDAIIAGLRRPPTWREAATAQLRIFIPAVATGTCMMLFAMQFAFQTPTATTAVKFNPHMAESINVGKLMQLIDTQGGKLASLALLRDSMVANNVLTGQPAKIETQIPQVAPLSSTPRLV
jgi:hypothetical protein